MNYYYRNVLLNYSYNLKKKEEEEKKWKKGKSKGKKDIYEIEDEDEKSEVNKDNKKDERKKRKRNEKSKKNRKILKRGWKWNENINKNNILIEQEQVNGKILDQAFNYSEKNKQIFIGFQN